MLQEAGVGTNLCVDMAGLENSLSEQLGAVVVTEEAVAASDLRGIAAWLRDQKPWSDLPFIILTQRGGGLDANPEAARLSALLGNVIFLERPFRAATFISVVRTALRGRMRQYEMRDQMAELRESEERLQTALLAGRLGSWELEPATSQLEASEMTKRIFGRQPEDDFEFQELLASIHPEEGSASMRRCARLSPPARISSSNIASCGPMAACAGSMSAPGCCAGCRAGEREWSACSPTSRTARPPRTRCGT